MVLNQITTFELLYMTVREIYFDQVDANGLLPHFHLNFEISEMAKKNIDFNSKFASVLNYVTAQVLLKAGCASQEIERSLAEIVDEQINQINLTMINFPDGPLAVKNLT